MANYKLPFSLSKRPNSRFYYVRFKDDEGNYLSAVSTKESDYDKAVKLAWQWYSSGEIESKTQSQKLNKKSFLQILRKAEISEDEAPEILELLKKRGFLKSYVQAGAKNDVPFSDFLLNFWDWEKSEYIQEKLRGEKRIGKTHCRTCLHYVRDYWAPFFKNKLLGDIERKDLKNFLAYIQKMELSNSAKNQMWLSGAQALRWAHNNELIDRDITAGLSGFCEKNAKREILTPEMVQALFSVEWEDQRFKLANLLAMCTGLRAGEIRALRKCDLGESCLYIRHSWNDIEGLKCTKNGENRIVRLPFPGLSDKLLELAEANPYDRSMNAFVFFATIPEKPIEARCFLSSLRTALEKIGLSKDDAKKYCFHAWRHFYASYMRDKVGEKLLQSQTGHKTIAMLEHYSEHKISGDDEKIQQAQTELFGAVVENASIEFSAQRLYQNVKITEMDKSGLYEHSRQNR
ncbi:MAG: tyrosine-type recombinase/integrase [Treponema sp.]|nr:tyrosine-type recombinase/integrase [Treponema sp.]